MVDGCNKWNFSSGVKRPINGNLAHKQRTATARSLSARKVCGGPTKV
jgi:hypothetical protein